MRIRSRQLLLMLILTAMMLAGCVENSVHSDGGTAGPTEITPPAAEEPDIPKESTSQPETNPLDAQYMQGEFWKLTEDSSDLLPLDTDETPTSYFEQLQSQATAEAERYIQEICLPELENFQAEYGGTKTGDTFYEETRIDNLEPAGVFCKDGTRYLVYILDFSAHVAPGTELLFAGGMSMDDGWMDPGPGHILAFSLENDGSIQLSFGHQGDIFPHHCGEDQELFQQSLSLMLAEYLMDQENS